MRAKITFQMKINSAEVDAEAMLIPEEEEVSITYEGFITMGDAVVELRINKQTLMGLASFASLMEDPDWARVGKEWVRENAYELFGKEKKNG